MGGMAESVVGLFAAAQHASLATLSAQMGVNYEGLSVAARAGRKAQLISQSLAKRLVRLDVAAHFVRHMTSAKVAEIAASLAHELADHGAVGRPPFHSVGPTVGVREEELQSTSTLTAEADVVVLEDAPKFEVQTIFALEVVDERLLALEDAPNIVVETVEGQEFDTVPMEDVKVEVDQVEGTVCDADECVRLVDAPNIEAEAIVELVGDGQDEDANAVASMPVVVEDFEDAVSEIGGVLLPELPPWPFGQPKPVGEEPCVSDEEHKLAMPVGDEPLESEDPAGGFTKVVKKKKKKTKQAKVFSDDPSMRDEEEEHKLASLQSMHDEAVETGDPYGLATLFKEQLVRRGRWQE